MKNFLSEDDIEIAVVKELSAQELPWRTINCYTADAEDLNDRSGRSDKSDVVFRDILRKKLDELNPGIPEKAIDQAEHELSKGRRAMTTMNANIEIYKYIREGVPVSYENEQGKEEHGFVKVIDFDKPTNNDFLAVQQLWIKGEICFRRPDVILYINGLPLVLVELKNNNVSVRNAYKDNLTTYKQELPQLFWYNAVTLLSNAKETKVGSFTATWEHFGEWLRIDDEKERPNKKEIRKSNNSLRYTLNGLCTQPKLLDYIENFVLYNNTAFKVTAKNHQFIGVNKAIDAFDDREDREGKLGVFWHTQGSGKSYSMVFFARKIFRKFSGNFTFLIITDRDDLDTQIYRNFLNMGACHKADTSRPKNSKELREVLATNKRYIFTLIQKFRYDKGKKYPLISERDDIIVIVDEAHRTQYASLAENLRTGLPNAQFIAFTGTPLLGKERKTYKWFGDYISEYNFAQAIEDGATVPLYYDKRLPELQITNDELNEDLAEILEEENLDEKQQQKLEDKYATTMEVITRDDRLDTIAHDIAYHFPRRGYLGKGMVICVDKYTTVKMYDKVKKNITEQLKALRKELQQVTDENERTELKRIIDYLNWMDMAVIISEDADEKDKFKEKGLNIQFHRERMNELDENGKNVEDNFKDPEHKLQLVFVCAMWLTGFDAPTVSTLYLDKPMKNHTLMQTIARANRVAPGKRNGLIVDYFNVFRNIKRALTDYGQGEEADPTQNPEGQDPVEDKSQLLVLLDEAVASVRKFCLEHEVDLDKVLASGETFSKLELFDDYADILLAKDELRKEFYVYDNTCYGLYEACRPDILKMRDKYQVVEVVHYLRGVIDNHIGKANIERAEQRISELLDQSVLTNEESSNIAKDSWVPQNEYKIKGYKKEINLAAFDIDKLREQFPKKNHKNIEIADLRAFIEDKLEKMLEQNVTRASFIERFQAIIDRYNAGSKDNPDGGFGVGAEDIYNELLDFVNKLKEEDQRHIELGLTEDELELFDLIRRDKLTKEQEHDVKNAAKHLLKRLREEQPKVLVQDWFKDSETKEKVKGAIEEVLDKDLPQIPYGRKEFAEASNKIFDHVYVQASLGRGWVAA
ncbi:MAG: type I restriction endonuclease subunit R [Crocinitomicaceae bacterium]|nr:type I restriction endonuclease subunit R [Crocinitomicaceae bacterium]